MRVQLFHNSVPRLKLAVPVAIACGSLSILVSILWSTTALAEPVSTKPTLLAEIHTPCIAFTDDADYISQSLIMQLEDRAVPLRIPRPFFEDFWDQRDGFADTAQLFRVEIGTFLPVSRAETGRRNKQDIWNWMTFVIGDRLPLEELAEYYVEKDVNTLRVPPLLPTCRAVMEPFGLLSLRRGDGKQQDPMSARYSSASTHRVPCPPSSHATRHSAPIIPSAFTGSAPQEWTSNWIIGASSFQTGRRCKMTLPPS